MEILTTHPSTAHFICRKLAEHYVTMPAPEGLVNDLAVVYTKTGGDLQSVLMAIAVHPEFWKPDLTPKMLHPLEFALRLSRCCQVDNPWAIHDFLEKSGASIFDCMTPDGYPETDDAYADSNAMLQRWRLGKHFEWELSGLIPWPLHTASVTDPEKWRQEVVDCIAIRLTGHVFGKASNEAAIKLFTASPADANIWPRELAVFSSHLPEVSLK